MKDKIILIWQNLSNSYWFIPSLMICGTWLVLGVMLRIDADLTSASWISKFSWLYMETLDGARQLLGSIVGSLITVIGLLFSMTMVVFTLASSQYGPQVMRHFLGDRVTQVVLGTLVSTFIYCLLVLRSIGAGAQSDFIPHVSITVALFLTLVSLYMLIYFIHHVSAGIQPQRIIKDLAQDLNESLEHLFPDALGKNAPQGNEHDNRQRLLNLLSSKGTPVIGTKGGYVQAIANEDVLEIAKKHKVKILLEVMPGDFIVGQNAIATVYPPPKDETALSKALNEAVLVGSQRTSHQDIKYAIERMVEIGVRALSPGVNEPFLSIMCIDYLSLALNNLSRRRIPSSFRLNDNDEITVVTKTISYKTALEVSFDQILHYGSSNPMVQERIKTHLSEIMNLTTCDTYRTDIEDYLDRFFAKE